MTEPEPPTKTRVLSTDPRDNELPTPKWVPRSDPEIARYWINRIRDQLAGVTADGCDGLPGPDPTVR